MEEKLSLLFGSLVHANLNRLARALVPHIHTHARAHILLADCLILSPLGGVSQEESEGLGLDTRVRAVIFLPQCRHTHQTKPNHTHAQPPTARSVNTAQVCV